MVELYGQVIKREQLLARVGDVAQVGGVRLGELGEGRGRGVRVADFRTGSGLCFTVHIDRGLDIGAAEFCGEPLAWCSAAGVVSPMYYEPEGIGWVRGFAGGLMTTCGLGQAGVPCTDEGRSYGLHGPISYTPAQGVLADGSWSGDEYEMFVQGKVREGALFGDKLELSRRIWARLGESRLFIKDRVSNVGSQPAPLMIIYHCNLGYPLVDEGAELISPSREVLPRDEAARAGLGQYHRFERPQAGYAEQVFYHDMAPGAGGLVTVGLANHRASVGRGLGVYLRYPRRELPRFTEWKMMGHGDYVVGLEPGNAWPEGRASARAHGRLELLGPGEVREFHLEIGVLADNGAIERLEQDLRLEHDLVRRET